MKTTMETPHLTSTDAAPALKDVSASVTPPQSAVTLPNCSFGIHLEILASYYGIAPADVALAVSSFLGNIAGPYAGFVDCNGHRYRQGLSVLSLSNGSPRIKSLEEALLHPLRTRTTHIRNRARSISRPLADRSIFGRQVSTIQINDPVIASYPWIKDHDANNLVAQKDLFSINNLPWPLLNESDMATFPYFREEGKALAKTSPGPIHLPSLFFERVHLDSIHQFLSESLHREALICHPLGEIFCRAGSAASKTKSLAIELAACMRGKDMAFKPLNSLQGHGTFEYARIHLWASTTLAQVGSILADRHSPWNEVIKTSLLWEGSDQSAPPDKVLHPRLAMQKYRRVLHELLERRCCDTVQYQERKLLPPNEESQYQKYRMSYAKILSKINEPDREYVLQFHDLPERLLWSFMLFREEREPFWCIEAAFRTAVYAVQKQQHLLRQARNQHLDVQTMQALEAVQAILRRKGPCSMRDMQRSSNNLRADFLKPGVDRLRQQGLLRILPDHRFELVTVAHEHRTN